MCDGGGTLSKQLKIINPYGDEFPVEKEDCVNHVGKRLGTVFATVSRIVQNKV